MVIADPRTVVDQRTARKRAAHGRGCPGRRREVFNTRRVVHDHHIVLRRVRRECQVDLRHAIRRRRKLCRRIHRLGGHSFRRRIGAGTASGPFRTHPEVVRRLFRQPRHRHARARRHLLVFVADYVGGRFSAPYRARNLDVVQTEHTCSRRGSGAIIPTLNFYDDGPGLVHDIRYGMLHQHDRGGRRVDGIGARATVDVGRKCGRTCGSCIGPECKARDCDALPIDRIDRKGKILSRRLASSSPSARLFYIRLIRKVGPRSNVGFYRSGRQRHDGRGYDTPHKSRLQREFSRKIELGKVGGNGRRNPTEVLTSTDIQPVTTGTRRGVPGRGKVRVVRRAGPDVRRGGGRGGRFIGSRAACGEGGAVIAPRRIIVLSAAGQPGVVLR